MDKEISFSEEPIYYPLAIVKIGNRWKLVHVPSLFQNHIVLMVVNQTTKTVLVIDISHWLSGELYYGFEAKLKNQDDLTTDDWMYKKLFYSKQ